MDMCRWQVAQGRFFVHQHSGKLFRNAEFCALKSILESHVYGWRRWVLTNKGDTEHPFICARLVAQETERTTNMDLTETSMTFAAIPLVEGFRFRLSTAMTGEKKRNPQDELVIAIFDVEEFRLESKVIHHAQQELPYPIVQCMERIT